MRLRRIVFGIALLTALGASCAAQFVVFPKASEVVSPDGRFAVRSVERETAASEIAGASRSLWLFEISTGHARKLCDYLGVAAAGWSGNDWIVVTQYVGKRTSRALVFSATVAEDPVMLDKNGLIRLVPADLRPALRENDHVFVEASHVEHDKLSLTVWGYGPHNTNGFRWRCEYSLREGTVSCSEEPGAR